MFEPANDGLCPACKREDSPAAVEKARQNEALRQSEIEQKLAREAELKNMLAARDLPELPCLSPKALKCQGSNLIFIEKKKNIVVPLQNIASFSLKRPSFGTNGTITIQLQKGNDVFASVGGFGVGLGSEMTAVFSPKYLEIAELYEKYVLTKDDTPQVSQPVPQSGEAVPTINDLRALKQLVDEGILTEEEFTAKKKQLLGI